ncbi:MAG: hypothetical protein ACRD3G_11975 [Vicinamibacterales bacterium]
MDVTGRPQPLSDSQLDREIAAAVGIEPSAEFLARVRTRIAADPALVVESGFSRIRRLSFEPLAGVAIVGIVLAVVVPRFIREETARPQVMRSPVVDVRVPAVEARTAPQASKASTPRAPEAAVERTEPHTLPLQLSPVQFAEEDRIALAWFATAVADGTVAQEKVVQALGEEEMAPLAITSLVIDPLPPLARVERQGEGQW